MKNEKETFLIIFEDKTKFNMIMHIKTEKVDDKFLLYLEPCARVEDTYKNSRHRMIDCKCDNCSERLRFLTESSKQEEAFNGIGFVSEEEFVSFVCIRLLTLSNIEILLEKITGEKIKHISLIDKKVLFDSFLLTRYYANSGFEKLLKDLGLRF